MVETEPPFTDALANAQAGPAKPDGAAPLDAELRTRAILDNVVDGVITIDSEGSVLSMNAAAERIFGYPAAEVLGRNVNLLMPEPYRSEHDEYLRGYLRTRRSAIIGIGRRAVGLRRDNSTFPMELAVSSTQLPSGEIFTGLVRDVTTAVAAEQALRDAEARMRAIVETAVDGIIVIDETGTIEAFNAAAERMFGYKAAEVMGSNVAMLMPSPYREAHDRYVANYLTTGVAKIIGIGREVLGLRKDQTTFPMELAVADTRLEGRRLFTGIGRDITERKRSEDAIREATKLESLALVAGGVAHEFNNLLAGILGNAWLALQELPQESTTRVLLRDIEEAAKRAASLAHQMLAYSGQGRLVVEDLEINRLVEDTAQLLSGSIRESVDVRHNLSPGLPRIAGDPNQLRQAITNLVINGAEAIGDESGVITISTGLTSVVGGRLSERYFPTDLADGQYVFLEVSDTGRGMTPEERVRIFDPFFTTKFTGRGLGLAVVSGVVRGHKGSINVDSAPGHATAFKLLLPCGPDARAEEEAPS